MTSRPNSVSSHFPASSVALLTDLYELTMACAYFRQGRHEDEAVFHVDFRSLPFQGGYSVAAGLGYVLDFLERFRFDDDDLSYLGTLCGSDNKPLFDKAFLDYLRTMTLQVDIDGIVEGTVVFPHSPLLRVRGPILQCQILETPLLNMLNFQTLAATKAARVCDAAKGDPVLEFGLRRAQGFDGALAASRAAFIGGCAATSNVLAGRLFGIPVKGTHAHSWVMSFDSELASFRAWCDSMPNNIVLLVDTFDTHEGIRRAIEVGLEAEARGMSFEGIRLDSGDLAWLSIEARRMLDAAGLQHTQIVASNDLDEYVIASLKDQGSVVNIWGVGTKLATCSDQPALGGVYKLSAYRGSMDTEFKRTLKLGEESAKVSTPGILQTRRFSTDGGKQFVADMIWDELMGEPGTNSGKLEIVDPADPLRRRTLDGDLSFEDLLIPMVRRGQLIYEQPNLSEIRDRVQTQLACLDPTVRRFLNPHRYPAGLERGLADLRSEMMLQARSQDVTE